MIRPGGGTPWPKMVARNAAHGLVAAGRRSGDRRPDRGEALRDGNRYAVGYAAEALERIGTPEAGRAPVRFLKTARWCPLTTAGSLF